MNLPPLDRRSCLALLAGLPAARPVQAAGRVRIAALFAGRIDDGGFMQAGYEGLERARAQLGVATGLVDGIAPKPDELSAALRRLAASAPDLVVAHGGQNAAAARAVARAFPQTLFAVTQGDVTGQNLASYRVLQEQSAYLAGVLAGLTTKSGKVGHLSGLRVKPGLEGRAAFADGLRSVRPDARLLTNFSGDQDDPLLARRVALAMIDVDADIVFTMLNAGRRGAIDACKERGVPQIGNVIDWTKVDPDLFIASACADSGRALFNAVRDVFQGTFQGGVVHEIGLEVPDAVRLALSPNVPERTRAQLTKLTTDIVAGRCPISTEWDGPEFATPPA